MGLRGPSAKPVELRALEGTDSRVISFPTNDVLAVAPASLGPQERAVWRRVVATFPAGFFKSADERHLAAYCVEVIRWEKSNAKIVEDGEVLASPYGPKKNPWLAVQKQAHAQMVQLGDRLGIGPGRRTQSVMGSAQAKKADLLSNPKHRPSSGS